MHLILLYGYEMWPDNEKMIVVFDNDSIRRMPSAPPPYKYTGTGRAKKVPLAWSHSTY